MNVFTENAGRFLNRQESELMTDMYRERKLAAGLTIDDYVRSEYFGINQVKHLLDQPGCVGLRVHHAKRWEDENGDPTEPGVGQLKPRVLLTGVDKNGRDMPIRTDNGGLKDMASTTDAGGQSLGEGRPCPQYCGK
jgi:hypothetical protein